jgi:hypothetical protein
MCPSAAIAQERPDLDRFLEVIQRVRFDPPRRCLQLQRGVVVLVTKECLERNPHVCAATGNFRIADADAMIAEALAHDGWADGVNGRLQHRATVATQPHLRAR